MIVQWSKTYPKASFCGVEAAGSGRAMCAVELDAEIVAAEFLRRNEGRAGAAERVEHQAARRAERRDERL